VRNRRSVALSALLLLIFGWKQLNARSMPVGQVSGNLRARPAVTKENNLFVAEIKNNAPEPCSKTNEQSYDFNHWFPVSGCSPDAVQNFFQVSGSLSIANTVHYLYSPNQSTNQSGTDLLTATFPLGFQAILSGTATAGGSQPSREKG